MAKKSVEQLDILNNYPVLHEWVTEKSAVPTPNLPPFPSIFYIWRRFTGKEFVPHGPEWYLSLQKLGSRNLYRGLDPERNEFSLRLTGQRNIPLYGPRYSILHFRN